MMFCMQRMIRKYTLLTLLLGFMLACATPLLPTATPTATATPTLIPTATLPPTPTPIPPDTGWETLEGGFDLRSLDVQLLAGKERVTLARVDPLQYTLEVHYIPQGPMPISLWHVKAGGLLVVNAGYFTEEYYATGVIITHGYARGASYGDFAGMLAVRSDGESSVRWLRERPYDPAEPLEFAVQCFPVLVKPGGVMGFPADADDGRAARRTVVAQDRRGRLLFLVAPRGYFSLHELAVWLTVSDLDVDIALNLDGGTSTGMWIAGAPAAQIDSSREVPAVIIVKKRAGE